MLVNKFVKRDYSLVSTGRSAVALDDELIEEKVEGTWWSPNIPRKELKGVRVEVRMNDEPRIPLMMNEDE